ncbi:hypothetical protein Tco_0467352 [Tanacetum coccineum]
MISEETPKKSKEQILQEEASLAEEASLTIRNSKEVKGTNFAKKMVDKPIRRYLRKGYVLSFHTVVKPIRVSLVYKRNPKA